MIIIGEDVNISEENLNTEFRKIDLKVGRTIAPHDFDIEKLFGEVGTLEIFESDEVQVDTVSVTIGEDFYLDDENSIWLVFLNDKTPVCMFSDPNVFILTTASKLGIPMEDEHELHYYPLDIHKLGIATYSPKKLKQINSKRLFGDIKSATKLDDDIIFNVLFEVGITVKGGLITLKDIKPLVVNGTEFFEKRAREKKEIELEKARIMEEKQKQLRIIAEQEKEETRLRNEAESKMKSNAYAKKGAQTKRKKEKTVVNYESNALDYTSKIQDILG